MNISRIGIDLAKNVFQLHGVDRQGKAVWKRRLKRDQWLKAVLSQAEPGCEIGMEACSGAHHWARELESRGYMVKLIAPQFVKPYVKSNVGGPSESQRRHPNVAAVALANKTVRMAWAMLRNETDYDPDFAMS